MQVLSVYFAAGWAVITYLVYLVVVCIRVSRSNARKAKQLKCLPPVIRENSWPFGIDFILRMIKADKEKRFPPVIQECLEEMKVPTFQHSLLGEVKLETNDPENIKALLATQFEDFEIPQVRHRNFLPLFGNGIFTQNGKDWAHSRAMLRPQFARSQVSDLDREEAHVQHLLKALPVKDDGWTAPSDLQVLFFRLTMDTATDFLFGTSVNSQMEALMQGTDPPVNSAASGPTAFQFSQAFDQAMVTISARFRLGPRYWMLNPKAFQENCKIARRFIDGYVTKGLERNPEGKSVEGERYIFLDSLTTETRDPIEIRDQLLHILFAGRDTTAALLGWFFFTLARSPKHYAKLRQRILLDFGNYSENAKEITYAKIRDCAFLQHCIKETLRLYPLVPFNARTAIKDTTLPRGGGPDGSAKIFLPKGRQVNYAIHVMHHRKDIWGEDAEEFIPERWEGKKVGWEYLPFNGGPRICLGQQFALTEAGFVIVRLLQRFDRMENLGTLGEVKHNLVLTNSPGDGVQVRLHKA